MTPDQVTALAALANGIIPADEVDTGAAAVRAGTRLAERIEAGIETAIYLDGLETASSVAREDYGRDVCQLIPAEVERLLGLVRERVPLFFARLRMDVSAMYLSDTTVWRRIGFPGPSTSSGGYADFDQEQTEKLVTLKESAS